MLEPHIISIGGVDHEFQQEIKRHPADGNMDKWIPQCRCGWQGYGIEAYNDDMWSRIRRQFDHHMEDARKASAASAPAIQTQAAAPAVVPEVIQALQAAEAALEYSELAMKHYPEPVVRHLQALVAVRDAIAMLSAAPNTQEKGE